MRFDAQDPGTASSAWVQDARWRAVPPLDLAGVASLLVLAAHPDDETLGAGALLADAVSIGLPVTVVIVTDGAAADPQPATVEGSRALAETRAAEARSAMAALGVDDLRLLDFADGAVREQRADIAAAVARIAAERPGTLVVAPWVGDGHRDHRVLGEVATEVAASCGLVLWCYPIWMWHWATPSSPEVPWSRLASLVASPQARFAKMRALSQYPSQTDGVRPVLHDRFLKHFARSEELFVRLPAGRSEGQ